MKIEDKLTLLHRMDKKLWGDKIESNPYFSSLSALFIAIYGGYFAIQCIADSDYLNNHLLVRNLFPILGIWILNIGESIFATKDIKTPILRSLLLLLIFPLSFILGGVIVVVVLLIVIIWLVWTIFSAVLGGSSSSQKAYKLDDGTEVERNSDLFGDSNTYTEKGGSRTFHDTGNGYVQED